MANIFTRAFWNSRGESVTTQQVDAKRNLLRVISPATLERIRQSVTTWRECAVEAEQAWFPHRVKMQRLFQDTILNGQVYTCMEKRRDLTLLRDFIIVNESGEELEEWTKFFKTPWFYLWMTYGLDALAYGYQLVAHGDIVGNQFPNLQPLPRQNVSPDRLNVGTFVYSTSGTPFMDEPFLDWHTYFSTPADNGRSSARVNDIPPCGYGYLYTAALPEIYIRNAMGANADYVQVFGQPYRVGKTSKTEEHERAEMANTLDSMGSSNWAVVDPEDMIEFIEAKGAGSGNGHLSYDNLITRCEKLISKIILGHADAADSTAGKLGAEQGEDSPVHKALMAKKTKDGAYIENAFNLVLIQKLQAIGVNFPIGATGKFKNDEEDEETREKEYERNLSAATIMKTISDAGGEPDWAWFNDQTNMKVEKKEVEETETPEQKANAANEMIEKVKNLYRP